MVSLGGGCTLRPPFPFEVVVMGGTPSGVAAAVAAAREGYKVCLIAEQDHLGGMMSSGLSSIDPANPELIGGISREVFMAIAGYYRDTYGPGSEQYKQCNRGFSFEPHVAEMIFEKLVEEEGIALLRGWHFVDCDVELNRITGVHIRNRHTGEERTIGGGVFVDATYTGDFFAEAGAPYSLGREGRKVYGELLAGHIYQDPVTRKPLPGSTHEGDSLIQAYNYRLCLTDSLQNMAPLPEPENYDQTRYRKLYDFFKTKGGIRCSDYLVFRPLPNRKFDVDNNPSCWVSSDLIGASQLYPDAELQERARIEKAHMEHLLGLLKFLRTDPQVPSKLRDEFTRYGLARDEFKDNRHLPFQLYIREARRVHAPFTFTERDALTDTLKEEAIGVGSFPLRSQATGSWRRSYPWAEGCFVMPSRTYQIPYSVMLPAWVRNLLVSVCVSASHVGYGALRAEPVSMILGQAAGIAAALCLEYNCEVDEVPVHQLQERLRRRGAVLSLAEARPWTEDAGDFIHGNSAPR